jgi:hypothetical protein
MVDFQVIIGNGKFSSKKAALEGGALDFNATGPS